MLNPGLLLQNRYQIIRLLGQGGMGAVYLANDLRLQRVVAVKENTGGDPRQFQQEAILLANLAHPNLPHVTDHFDLGNAQYLVMDFIEGEDLESILSQQGTLPETLALRWFDQVLDAISYLHGRGVIHRDIKPANIKITPQGKAVLVDFGIAKIYQPGYATQTGARAATPGFSAPEQYRGGTDVRSDVYSLGATLYALLTGQAPPDALSLVGHSAMLMPPRSLNSAISAQGEQVILRAMAIDVTQRFQSAAEMKRVLATAPMIRALSSMLLTPSPSLSPKRVTTSWQSRIGVTILGIFCVLLLCVFSIIGGTLLVPVLTPATTVAVWATETPSLTFVPSRAPTVMPTPLLPTALMPTATPQAVPLATQTADTTQRRGADNQVNLSQNLMGYWKFDEGNGVTVNDSSTSGRNGVLSVPNSPTWTTIKPPAIAFTNPYALNFDGKDDYVLVRNANSLSSAYTIALWVRSAVKSDSTLFLLTSAYGSTKDYSHQIRIANGKFQHYLWDGNQRYVNGTTSVITGSWYHIVILATSGGHMRLYVNGREEGAAIIVGELWSGGDRYYFGHHSGLGDGFFNGILDDVRVYARVLSQPEIAALASGRQ